MKVGGTVRPPGDKSLTHRALIIGAVAHSRAELVGALVSADIRSTARALRSLGAEVSPVRTGRVVTVCGAPWHRPRTTIHCGNSGTTARLLLGALAGQAFEARLTGDVSLRRRPMRRVTAPLQAMGATVTEERGDGLPLRIRGGTLRPLSYRTPVASAQLKSALLLAATVGNVPVTVTEPVRSRDHTELLLAHLGFDMHVDATSVTLLAPAADWPNLAPFRLEIPGDVSSAAFLVAAALLAEEGELQIEGVGVNPTRTGFLDILSRMGGVIGLTNERALGAERVADLLVRPAELRATEVDVDEVPVVIDEVPILAVLASRAVGETRFHAVGELRLKESDRLSLLARNLRNVGCRAQVEGDDLFVTGSDAPPVGRVDTAGDHRLAMAFAVLGTVRGARIELSETASARVSYPSFFEDLTRIRVA